MKERELLELAAKASKLSVSQTVPFYDDSNGLCLANNCWWNPLTDDGDALRLVIDLGLHIKMYYDHVDVVIFNKAINPVSVQFEYFDNGKAIATRYAIVRAAAEIGKSVS